MTVPGEGGGVAGETPTIHPSCHPSCHASCVSVGGRGVLLRGPSGAGKSRLAFALILAGGTGRVPEALLVADDRVRLDVRGGRLVASAPHNLAGLIEVRGAGLRRLPHLPEAAIDLVVDLQAADAARMPEESACRISINGIELARLPVFPAGDPLHQILATLLTEPFRDRL